MLLRNFFRTFRRLYSTATVVQSTSTFNPKEWDISVAVALFRFPIVAPLPTEIEQKYMKIAALREHEQSYKSDFELKTEKDLTYVIFKNFNIQKIYIVK